jgi:serine-type D-Ala-D-Ala carboxypeptidase/endopeptidase (penicillin-binding protein 4)
MKHPQTKGPGPYATLFVSGSSLATFRNHLLFTTLLLTCLGCAGPKRTISRTLDRALAGKAYENQFTGLFVLDAQTKDTLYDHNGAKYFTPASNTKIFTLYTALKALPGQIPALAYVEMNDTLHFQGTGDPSFLHPYLKDSTGLHFLKAYQHLVFYPDNFQDDRFGPGWSWDDYHWYYSPERSAFPIHGNVAMITRGDGLMVQPTYFKDSVMEMAYVLNRKEANNIFYFDPTRKDTLEVPFKTGTTTTHALLETLLERPLGLGSQFPEGEKKTLYGMAADSLYKRLMVESDNFIAEQLLVLAAHTWKDTLNTALARDHVLETYLPQLPQQPRWVDGSGLSRYNLFTPQSMVYVLQRLLEEMPKERLYALFPVGGDSGTLEEWYGSDGPPYIHAKSGSLGNNYCLSGYLETTSGKTLIFSFMNNHFRSPASEVKKQMQAIFEAIRDGY